MRLIILVTIGIAITTMLFGSLIFQFLNPAIAQKTMLEEKCEKIAYGGFQIHLSYPDLSLDQIPAADRNRLMYLDEMWIKDCISGLSAETIFNIVQKVEHDFYSRE